MPNISTARRKGFNGLVRREAKACLDAAIAQLVQDHFAAEQAVVEARRSSLAAAPTPESAAEATAAAARTNHRGCGCDGCANAVAPSALSNPIVNKSLRLAKDRIAELVAHGATVKGAPAEKAALKTIVGARVGDDERERLDERRRSGTISSMAPSSSVQLERVERARTSKCVSDVVERR